MLRSFQCTEFSHVLQDKKDKGLKFLENDLKRLIDLKSIQKRALIYCLVRPSVHLLKRKLQVFQCLQIEIADLFLNSNMIK